jgi:hypothetical protein
VKSDKRGTKVKKYGRRYPWKKWLASKSFSLFRGKDFNGRAYTMAQQVRNRVRGHATIRVSIEIADDDRSLTVHVLRKGG